MISSEQVAALMEAQQRRASMLQATYSGGYTPQGGTSQYPPAFSYAQQNPTMGARAAAFTGAGIQAIPGVVTTASAAAGVASMFGVQNMGVRMLTSPFIDPFGHGIAMGARAAGGALMGGEGVFAAGAAGIGAAAPWMAAGAAGFGALYGGTRLMGQGFQDYSQMQGAMSRYSFANMNAPGFRGFSHQDMSSIMGAMRSFDTKDSFTGFADTQRMLQGFNEMGMAQGVRDAQEVAGRLKKMMQAVKDIARATGTSLDDAMSNYAQMRQAGFFSNRDVTGNAASMRLAQGLGISNGAFIGAQQAGAATYRGMAMSGRSGALQATGTAESLLTMRGLGGISDEKIMDVFGSEDAATGALEFGRQMSSGMGNFFRNTAQGRALLLAGGEMVDGKYTGRIDQGFMDRVANGELGFREITAMAGARERTPEAMLSFRNKENRISSDLLSRDDSMKSVGEYIRRAIKETFGGSVGDEGTQQLVQQLLGVNSEVADMYMSLIKDWETISSEKRRQMVSEVRAAREQARMRQGYTAGGLWQSFTGGVADAFSPIRSAGSSLSATIQQRGTDVMNSLMGVETLPGLSDEQARRGAAATMAGGARPEGATPEAMRSQLGLLYGMRSGTITPDLFADRISPERRAFLDQHGRRFGGVDYNAELSQGLLSGDISGVVNKLDTTNPEEIAYLLSSMGSSGSTAAKEYLQQSGVDNAMYGAGSRSLIDALGGFWSAGGMGRRYRMSGWKHSALMNNEGGAADILADIQRVGVDKFFGANDRNIFDEEVLRLRNQGVGLDAARAGGLRKFNETFGTDASLEGLLVASSYANDLEGKGEFSDMLKALAPALSHRSQSAMFDSIMQQGFGDLEGSEAAGGLRSFVEAAFLGGDPTEAYRSLLSGEDTTEGREGPLALALRNQRESYRRLGGRKGNISEEDLAKELGWKSRDLAMLPGFEAARAGGITPEEAQTLFTQGAGAEMQLMLGGTPSASTRTVGGAAARGTDEALSTTLEQNTAIQEGLVRVIGNQITTSTALKDEVLKLRGQTSPVIGSVSGPPSNDPEGPR